MIRDQWVKSRRCDNSGPNCVEVLTTGDVVMVRDSKDPAGPALTFSLDEWATFVSGAADGEFTL